jgi:POT family proton-dependent oligopeptide transporter
LGECFCYTTAYELAYTRAPDNAKGLVMALFLFNSAISSAISQAVSGALVDPNLIWPFTGIAAAGGFCAFVFLIMYWNLDKVMEKEELEREAARQSVKQLEHAEIQSLVRSFSR